MKSTVKALVSITTFLIFAGVCRADIPGPGPRPRRPIPRPPVHVDVQAQLVITGSSDKQARLTIPRSLLKQLSAAVGEDQPAEFETTASSALPVHTILAGIFLTLSLAFAGVWIVRARRSGGPLGKSVVAAIAAIIGLLIVIVLADIVITRTRADVRLPDGPVRVVDAGTLPQALNNGNLTGQVQVEWVEEGDQITLTVPK